MRSFSFPNSCRNLLAWWTPQRVIPPKMDAASYTLLRQHNSVAIPLQYSSTPTLILSLLPRPFSLSLSHPGVHPPFGSMCKCVCACFGCAWLSFVFGVSRPWIPYVWFLYGSAPRSLGEIESGRDRTAGALARALLPRKARRGVAVHRRRPATQEPAELPGSGDLSEAHFSD